MEYGVVVVKYNTRKKTHWISYSYWSEESPFVAAMLLLLLLPTDDDDMMLPC
jgi:hypothetical protein